jgi:gliding motility-associated lipoprotein GldH
MIMQRARFHHEGEYRFEVRQAMRSDSLKGIEDIGIRIEKYQ